MSRVDGPRREVDRGTLGIVGSLGVIAALIGALVIPGLSFIRDGKDYSALFTEAGGLGPGDDVIVAGQKVGRVDDLAIDHGLARVDFHVSSGVVLPDRTRAQVKVLSLLGRKALALQPAGHGAMAEGELIPVQRTVAPYDVAEALEDLTRTGQGVDSGQLGQAFATLADTLNGGSAELGPALEGLNRLSATIASRDEALRGLLEHARGVTGVLADRNQQITTLIRDGNHLLAELQQRYDAIRALLISTTQVSQQLSGLIDDNRATTGPSLRQLRDVLDLLDRNRDNLAKSLREAVPFIRALGEAVSSGPFFQVYIQNLVPYDLKPGLFRSTPTAPTRATDRTGDQLVPGGR